MNAIYLNLFWKTPFDPDVTRKINFYLDERNFVSTDFMVNIDVPVNYALLSEFDAELIELPFNVTGASFFIFLPQSRTGLPALESKLSSMDFDGLKSKMTSKLAVLRIPRFIVNFNIDFRESLEAVSKVVLA